MMERVRIYLLLRDSGGEWAVTVHQNLEPVIEEWRSALTKDMTAVIHIGFSRPSTASFDRVAHSYPSNVLLTATARFAMTAGTYSRIPVGFVDDLPIYRALTGWAYEANDEIDDFASAIPPPESNGSVPIPTTLVGDHWLNSLATAQPALSKVALRVGIIDDVTYQHRESMLDWPVRVALARFRREQALVGGDRRDPIDVACASPPWVLSRPIRSLDTSVRAWHALEAQGITLVSDLTQTSYETLLRIPNFGLKSFQNVADRILDACGGPYESRPTTHLTSEDSELLPEEAAREAIDRTGHDPAARENVSGANAASLETSPPPSFWQVVTEAVTALGQGRAAVMRRRMGIQRKRETLQEIGDALRVTRERVRQIESRSVISLRSLSVWKSVLLPRLMAALEDRVTPLPVVGLPIVDQWFEGIDDSPTLLTYCLDNFLEGEFFVLEIDRALYVSRVSPQRWNEAVSQGRSLLERGAEEKWPKDRSRAEVSALMAGDGDDLKDVLWFAVQDVARFASVDGVDVLVAYGKSREDLVAAVLAEAERPLHYSEVRPRVHGLFGIELSVRNVHAACAGVGLLFGRGTFGTMKHFPFSSDEANALIAATEDIIVGGPESKQWHCSELIEEIESASGEADDRLDPYTLCIALRSSSSLLYLGRLVWAAKRRDLNGARSRLDLTQAVIALLSAAGRPLHCDAIVAELSKQRGVNCTFQVHSTRDLVPLGKGMWGLAHRDIGLSLLEQQTAIEDLATVLEGQGVGLHVTEVLSALPLASSTDNRINLTALVALAQIDGRMRVGAGQYLFLTKWNGPRRLTVEDVVREALEKAESGLTIQDLLSLASQNLGRDIPRESAYGALRSVGAKWDEATAAWSIDMRDRDEVSDETASSTA